MENSRIIDVFHGFPFTMCFMRPVGKCITRAVALREIEDGGCSLLGTHIDAYACHAVVFMFTF